MAEFWRDLSFVFFEVAVGEVAEDLSPKEVENKKCKSQQKELVILCHLLLLDVDLCAVNQTIFRFPIPSHR